MGGFKLIRQSPSSRRAWIEIQAWNNLRSNGTLSPSSRRAWIEIHKSDALHAVRNVALLAEGVDRNLTVMKTATAVLVSPSSRRAWIEIFR